MVLMMYGIECVTKITYLTRRRTLSQLEKYNFSGEREKTTGWDDAIASKERHFSPLAAILENRRVSLLH
jgi:hypothetical protein